MPHNNNMDKSSRAVEKINSDDWVDTMVSCAQAMNKLFVHNTCRLCQVYSDKQVEFERQLQEENNSSSCNNPVDRAFLRTGGIPQMLLPEVELYRQFLFDEDSVVDSVGQREETDFSISSHRDIDDNNSEADGRTLMTQRTH